MSVEYFERSEGGADFDAEQLSEVSLDFDFDLPMDWFSTPTDTSGHVDDKQRARAVIKVNNTKTGGKFKCPTKKRLPHEAIQMDVFAKPICAFPSFDKSDALIYLPSTMTRHMNSGDIPSISRLLLSHVHKNCVVDLVHHPNLLPASGVNVKVLIKMLAVMSDIHPDSIACAQNTKVDGNVITSSIFGKFTDCRVISESVCSSIQDPVLYSLVGATREHGAGRLAPWEYRSDGECTQYLALAATPEDLLVYFRVDVAMTIDDVTKKVKLFRVKFNTTSMHLLPRDRGACDSTTE